MPTAPAAPPGLVYVQDSKPGWRRLRRGKGFAYADQHGRPIRDADALQRIRSLAIPPAYVDVWICPLANGHLQATGRDARGRKQYRYHAEWQLQQGQSKFERLREFGAALPRLRRRVKRDLAAKGLPREKVLATVVRLLDTTYMRIGNDEYARSNGSYGLTTLRRRHASVHGGVLLLAFAGKSGVKQQVVVDDPRLTRIVKRCQTLPGQTLFQYLGDDGEPHGIGSADVNDYLREASGGDFTAKDFRTWHASAMALDELLDCEAPTSKTDAKTQVQRVICEVAAKLGHTPTVCRKSYVHSAVIDGYSTGELLRREAGVAGAVRGLAHRERDLMALLASNGRRAASARRVRAGGAAKARPPAGFVTLAPAPMPLPMPMPMPLPLVLLALAIAAVWLPAVRLGPSLRLPAWPLLLIAALASGLAQGLLQPVALLPIAALAVAAQAALHSRRAVPRATMLLLAALLALGLALHRFPGFANPLLVQGLRLEADTAPMTLYANIDKGVAGLLLLACFSPRLKSLAEWRQCLRQALPLLALTALVVFGLALASGQVRLAPKWPGIAASFLVANLFFTCIAEEAFFRGLLQERLSRALAGSALVRWLPLAASTLLFGLAHAAGGPAAVVTATVAGFGYALAYQRSRRIEAAVLLHFGINAMHFLGFSYPHLAR